MRTSAVPGKSLSEPAADPFGEKRLTPLRMQARLLGGRFRFECQHAALLRIVRHAYARLPAHSLANPPPGFTVKLMLIGPQSRPGPAAPAPVLRAAGSGALCCAMGPGSFMSIEPERRAALLVLCRDALVRFPYHVRYELLESAVYLLASRVQRLVPLHAACVGLHGAGILLIGHSGSGKSTVTLHALLHGLEFLAEDSVMVKPDALLATGVASFLHLRQDSLKFLRSTPHAARIHESPVIRRRSGVEKLEVDVRRCGWPLAPKPLRIAAVVFVTRGSARKKGLLVPLGLAEAAARLRGSQRYAAGQPGWGDFLRRMRQVPAYELRRGRHPREAAEALRGLLRENG